MDLTLKKVRHQLLDGAPAKKLVASSCSLTKGQICSSSVFWLPTCNDVVVLDLNRALGNIALQSATQLESSALLASQSAATFSSLNFTELLASVQADSERSQSGTESVFVTTQPSQSATSLSSYVPSRFNPGNRVTSVSTDVTTYRSSSVGEQTSPTKQSQVHDDNGSETQASSSDTATPRHQATSSSPLAITNQAAADTVTTGNASGNSPAGNLSEDAIANRVTSPQKEPQQVSSPAAIPPSPTPQPVPQATLKQPATAATQVPASVPGSGQALSETHTSAAAKKSPEALVTEPSQSDGVSNVLLVNGKSTEKSKAHKESAIADGKNIPANCAPGTADASVILQPQATAGISNPGVAVATDPIPNTADLVSRGRSANRVNSDADLAFAVKIRSESPTISAPGQASSASGTGMDFSDSGVPPTVSDFPSQLSGMLSLSASKAALASGSSSEPAASGLSSTTISPTPGSAPTTANADGDIEPAEDTAPATAVAEDQPVNNQPIKTVQVQITGADDQKVDLKLVERSGSLTLSVRSADGSLTKALQQNLPDLSNRLNDQQIRAEWWRPDAQQAESSRSETAKNSGSSSTSSDNSANYDQGSQNKGDSGHQGGRGNRQPDWVEEHSISRKSNQNGTQFSWHL